MVVVGLDRSPYAKTAVEFALCDAARRGVPVDAVTAYESPEHWAWPYIDLTHTGDAETTTASPSRAPET